jgi:ribonuclease HII
MLIYAGIDEAGYGPFFGPLTVARFVLKLENHTPAPETPESPQNPCPDIWKLLSSAICRDLKDKKRRLAINDSKKLHTPSAGISNIERAALAFALDHITPMTDLGHWLTHIGNVDMAEFQSLPWYAHSPATPWQGLPASADPGKLAIDRATLREAMKKAGIALADLAVAPVLENRFNSMAQATRSKASVSFTFVAQHLTAIWDKFGQHDPLVVVDRQGGREHYRELLQFAFPHARLTILDENENTSAYRLIDASNNRKMTITFEVGSEERHLPAAMASVLAKYTRELLMARFQAYFTARLPDIKPTAGYGSDAKRFWLQLEPKLAELNIQQQHIKRIL